KGAAGEIPHGVLLIKHSCSSQLKSDKLLQNESYHEKSPRRKWAGVKNHTEKRRNFQHPWGLFVDNCDTADTTFRASSGRGCRQAPAVVLGKNSSTNKSTHTP
ncbi:hypothetical protein, partial [Gemmiger formicilis]|uniref:hypothetical protein n=1 Tax=Gemmiger formicilis TaxID=745368 RepID=UPI00241FD192